MKIKNKNIKLIALDLDGTLLTKSHKIEHKTKRLLQELSNQGIYIVIATGRNIDEVKHIIQELNIKDTYIIALNGQMIYDTKTKKTYTFNQLSIEESLTLINDSKQYHLVKIFDNNHILYKSKEYLGIVSYLHDLYQRSNWIFNQIKNRKIIITKNIEQYVTNNLNKICFTGSFNNTKAFKNYILNKYPNKYNVVLVSKIWLEVMDINVSKGKALAKVCQLANININETLAFGDGENDIDMLKTAGIGVCMQNGLESTKKASNYICKSNNHAGIYDFIINNLD